MKNLGLGLFSLFMVLILSGVYGVSAFGIESPTNSTYNTTNITFKIAYENASDIMYSIDDGISTVACTNCSVYENNLTLLEGSHTINVNASGIINFVSFSILIPNITINDSNSTINDTNTTTNNTNTTLNNTNSTLNNTNTTVNQTNTTTNDTNMTNTTNTTVSEYNYSIVIAQPQVKTYDRNPIKIRIESNKTIDWIKATIDGKYNKTCTNCSGINENINLTNGNYTLNVESKNGNITKSMSVNFKVRLENETRHNNTEDDENETKGNRTYDGSRFSKGFEKLPQLVMSGNITDDELAQIIRNNKLNPGVLNRLIKTGKLGNESIDAILDTQFKPRGIFSKFLSFIGIKQSTYATELYDSYNLTSKAKEKIVDREDFPKKIKDKVRIEVENERGNSGKGMPPGQARKENSGNNDDNNARVDDQNNNRGSKDNNSGREKNNNGKGNDNKQEKDNSGRGNGRDN